MYPGGYLNPSSRGSVKTCAISCAVIRDGRIATAFLVPTQQQRMTEDYSAPSKGKAAFKRWLQQNHIYLRIGSSNRPADCSSFSPQVVNAAVHRGQEKVRYVFVFQRQVLLLTNCHRDCLYVTQSKTNQKRKDTESNPPATFNQKTKR